MSKAVAIVSGGMDSVTLAYWLAAVGYQPILVTFDYGQRHKKEIPYAVKCAQQLRCEHRLIDLSVLAEHLTGSALTDTIPVPLGHYSAPSMRATVVPNRNAIMLSIAVGIAVAEGATVVATGVHAGDHPIYPDCRPAFIDAFTAMSLLATEGFHASGFSILAPFVKRTKADIVTVGERLHVPWADTWSCYQGEAHHCGRCGTCVERIEAFAIAGVDDPTIYAMKAVHA